MLLKSLHATLLWKIQQEKKQSVAGNETEGSEDDGVGGYRSASFVLVLFMIAISLLGLLGNGVSFCVFLRPRFRGLPTYNLLVARAGSDCLLILFSCPVFAIESVTYRFRSGSIFAFATSVSHYFVLYVYPFAAIFQTMSMWILVVLVAERWLYLCKPDLRKHCTTSRCLLLLAILLPAAVLYNLPRFWEFTEEGLLTVPRLREQETYWRVYGVVGYMLSQFVIPFGLISACSVYIVGKLFETEREHLHLTSSELREQLLGKMVLGVTLLSVICQSLPFVLCVVDTLDQDLFGTHVGHVFNDIGNLCILANAALTFLLFTRFSDKFRHEAQSVFLKCCFTRTTRESEFSESIRNLDRRQNSVRIDELTPEERTALRRSRYGRRVESGSRGSTTQSIEDEKTHLREPTIQEAMVESDSQNVIISG